MVAVAPPPTQGAAAAGEAARRRPAALLYLCCVVALAVGGGLLGIRLLQAGAQPAVVHIGPSGLGVPTKTSFGSVEVESVQQVRGLTPKQLAGMTHGIQSLVKADKLQVQLVLALRNARGTRRVRTGTSSPVACVPADRQGDELPSADDERPRRVPPRARRWRRRSASSCRGSRRRGRGSR